MNTLEKTKLLTKRDINPKPVRIVIIVVLACCIINTYVLLTLSYKGGSIASHNWAALVLAAIAGIVCLMWPSKKDYKEIMDL